MSNVTVGEATPETVAKWLRIHSPRTTVFISGRSIILCGGEPCKFNGREYIPAEEWLNKKAVKKVRRLR
jgi:hypothetical protein